jgi:hypothetical protein
LADDGSCIKANFTYSSVSTDLHCPHEFLHFLLQWNLWIATLRNEDILWNKDTSSGPKLLFSVQIALWNEDTSELGTLLARPKGVLISQVSLYYQNFISTT